MNSKTFLSNQQNEREIFEKSGLRSYTVTFRSLQLTNSNRSNLLACIRNGLKSRNYHQITAVQFVCPIFITTFVTIKFFIFISNLLSMIAHALTRLCTIEPHSVHNSRVKINHHGDWE